MYHGFYELCEYLMANYPGHVISPLRINGSAIESIFSSFKYIAGGHLGATNYSSVLQTFLTQKESATSAVNPNAEKGYRTF